ncbi:hypothetical protein CU254_34325 [Amycolatopsis sp. AA4]|uniref:hypothetical protein n=1 Tax=Actinomycetes TaxID=1760 RepID=UPI0001B540C0|nr:MULTISPECIES: hypothetical protein [Actinomycetes]ATY14915.1 hypothetical protein CU254_34325 [Amycolatopsis sp. AA4]
MSTAAHRKPDRKVDVVFIIEFGDTGQVLPHAVNLGGEPLDVAIVEPGMEGLAEALTASADDDLLEPAAMGSDLKCEG